MNGSINGTRGSGAFSPAYGQAVGRPSSTGPTLAALPTTGTVVEGVVRRAQRGEVQILDVRPRNKAALGLLSGSTAIEFTDSFAARFGWILDYDKPVALVADGHEDAVAALLQLGRIGKDDVCCTLTSLLPDTATVAYESVTLPEFLTRLTPDAQLLDVRSPSAVNRSYVPGSVRRYLPHLLSDGIPAELDPSEPVLVACESGYRAAVAASLLLAAGYTPVALADGGIDDLLAATTHPAA